MAIDGTELYRWSEPHCKHCLYAACGPKKELQYYHRVLELKLVSSNGLSLSILTEFIENDGEPDDKQDCELKASYRLLSRLKRLFPQLKLLLLGDGLYPKGPLFRMCDDFGWKYIFVLKDKVLKTVWEDFEGLMNLPFPKREKPPIIEKGGKKYRWQNDLMYKGECFDGHVNVMDVLSVSPQGETARVRGFITNFTLSKSHIEDLENLAQQRWKIENQGFDVQKHHGYMLEHVWSRDPNAMKVVYLLIQIAHLFNQLFIRSNLLDLNFSEKTNLTFFKQYLQAFTQRWSNELELLWFELKERKFQWRM